MCFTVSFLTLYRVRNFLSWLSIGEGFSGYGNAFGIAVESIAGMARGS